MTKTKDGRQQVEAMRKLAQPWAPDQLAGFRIGDRVRLSTVNASLTVIDFQPPSLLVLESDTGYQLRAGWKAVTPDMASPS